jgi:hypothetical protein
VNSKGYIKQKITKIYVLNSNMANKRYSERSYGCKLGTIKKQCKTSIIHMRVIRVYIEPVWRWDVKQTHKQEPCTVSCSKQSAAARKWKDTCMTDTEYECNKYVESVINEKSICKERKIWFKCIENGDLEGLKLVICPKCKKNIETNANERKKCNRIVSGEFGNLTVLDKMEAKAEDGPEMDVDGAISEGQNGKNCQRKISRKFVMLCAPSPNTCNKLFNGPIVTLSSCAQLSKLLIKVIKSCTVILMLLISIRSGKYISSNRINCAIESSMFNAQGPSDS